MRRRCVADEGKQTTNLASISKSKLSRFPFPVPPADEQVVLAERIFALLSAIDTLAARVAVAANRSADVERPALAKAFRGELVEPDPADEPAAALLGRLRANAAASARPPPRSPPAVRASARDPHAARRGQRQPTPRANRDSPTRIVAHPRAVPRLVAHRVHLAVERRGSRPPRAGDVLDRRGRRPVAHDRAAPRRHLARDQDRRQLHAHRRGEYDPTVATGRVKLGKDGRLAGTFNIRLGDRSTFIAERTEAPSTPIPPPPSPRDE